MSVGIVDAEAVVGEIGPIGWDDGDVAHLGDFVEAGHHELCRPCLGGALKGQGGFSVDDGSSGDDGTVDRECGEGMLDLGGET